MVAQISRGTGHASLGAAKIGQTCWLRQPNNVGKLPNIGIVLSVLWRLFPMLGKERFLTKYMIYNKRVQITYVGQSETDVKSLLSIPTFDNAQTACGAWKGAHAALCAAASHALA
jgi:hypothetical protein